MRGIFIIVGLAVVGAGCSGEPDCDTVFWYTDADGDGFGAGPELTGCPDERPADAVSIAGDCADNDALISPGAPELCNRFDDDCDGRIDDADPSVDPDDQSTFFTDLDDDGYGDETKPVLACVQPDGTALVAGDCNDEDAGVNPAAQETCDDFADLNCDGRSPLDDNDNDGVRICNDCDDADAEVGRAPQWYRDEDNDGFGDLSRPQVACERPQGFVADSTDCDDESIVVNPDADERCDEIDNDCDFLVDDDDDDVQNAPTWFSDGDGDTFGNPDESETACLAPPGTVSNGEDCDDGDPKLGLPPTWYLDGDDDGYGDELGKPQTQCFAPDATYVDNNEDCDDKDPLRNPLTEWWGDTDGDGYGEESDILAQCEQPEDYVDNSDDCDDTTHLVHPTRFDFDDDRDNDCDAEEDEDVGTELYDSSDIQAIVDKECGSCHVDATNGGLNMTTVHSAVVDVASGDVPSMDRVEPGDLRNSYLWHKLEGTHLDVGGAGDPMPQGGTLKDTDLDTFETWILEGAIE